MNLLLQRPIFRFLQASPSFIHLRPKEKEIKKKIPEGESDKKRRECDLVGNEIHKELSFGVKGFGRNGDIGPQVLER